MITQDSPAELGLTDWFPPGQFERVDSVLAEHRRLGVTHLRTVISWADYQRTELRSWFAWLIPRLADEVELVPCFTGTPEGLGLRNAPSSPPRAPQAFARFLTEILAVHGHLFSWVELWNDPNHLNGWDRRSDPDWEIFAQMISAAAASCHEADKKVILGGMCPADEIWLGEIGRLGLLNIVDAVGIQGFPGTWEDSGDDWTEVLEMAHRVLHQYQSRAKLWITAAGYSTWQHNEFQQLLEFVKILDLPVHRVHWYAIRDLFPVVPYMDIRHAHFGLLKSDNEPKLLDRIWRAEGLAGVRALAEMDSSRSPVAKVFPLSTFPSAVPAVLLPQPAPPPRPDYALITGGAGFIGTNLAHRLLSEGHRVYIFDNLSRPGVEQNLRWLQQRHGSNLHAQIGDVRDLNALRSAISGAKQVFHFASQVAVTTSLSDPLADFEVNLRGTVNLLEILREQTSPPPLLFTSTNKVYGNLDDLEKSESPTRYVPTDHILRTHGISEKRSLSFHSPYGCSKGGSDQYVLDYSRFWGLRTVVLRMSCIYGPHQFGTEDQGWVAHFLMQAILGQPVTVYGSGKQVRDILFVDDLLDVMTRTMARIDDLSGSAFNIGGGVSRSVSLIELTQLIAELHGAALDIDYANWRPGDQQYYVSDLRKIRAAIGWHPRTSVRSGVEQLYTWLAHNRSIPSQQLSA